MLQPRVLVQRIVPLILLFVVSVLVPAAMVKHAHTTAAATTSTATATTLSYPKGVVWHPWGAYASSAAVNSDLTDIQNDNVTWSRTGLDQGSSLSEYDMIVQAAKAHHVNILFSIQSDETTKVQNAWASWVTQVVNRYKYYVKHWEVGNEEDLIIRKVTSDPKVFAQLVHQYVLHLQETYQAVKAADPTATVLIGGMSDAAINDPPCIDTFVDDLLKENAAPYFDVIAFHPYAADVAGVITKLNTLRSKLATNRSYAAKPIWITEVGWYTGDVESTPMQVATEQDKADNLSQVVTALRNDGVSLPIFWYSLHETQTGITGSGYGLTVKDPTTLQTTYEPAYYAYKSL